MVCYCIHSIANFISFFKQIEKFIISKAIYVPYDTPDGTGVRDYIHVVDLAKGHIKALEKLEKEKKGIYIYNLGTGKGYSVLDMINAFEKSTGKKVKYKITQRRPGDVATCYADPSKAKRELNWEAEKTLEDMCKDSWNYIAKKNGNV